MMPTAERKSRSRARTFLRAFDRKTMRGDADCPWRSSPACSIKAAGECLVSSSAPHDRDGLLTAAMLGHRLNLRAALARLGHERTSVWHRWIRDNRRVGVGRLNVGLIRRDIIGGVVSRAVERR